MIKKTRTYFVLLAFISLIFSSCASKLENKKILLSDSWKYSLNQDGPFKSIHYSQLADLTDLIPDGTGFIYLQNKFLLPEDFANEDLSCYLGRITMADETYLNGICIGSKGRFGPENEWSAWNTSRIYHLPSNVLNFNEENVLQIKIWGDGECSLVSSPFISITDEVENFSKRQNFWNSKINLLFAAIFIIIAAYHFLIYFQRTKDTENFIFAFINLITALYLSVFYIDELPGLPASWMNFLTFQKLISNALPFFLPFLVTSFINEFFKRHEKRWILVLRIVFLLVPIGMILFSRNYPELRRLRVVTQTFLIPPLIYILYLIIRDMIKRKKEVLPILIGFSPLILAVIIDLFIHNILKLYNVPYISMYGWLLVIIAFLFILATRFSKARAEAEDLNAHLEQKVNERTKELSELNAKLEQINEESARDMRMASFVQQSFYPRKAPILDEYEIAYIFKPMAGVSGDLYDFFNTEKVLDGIALFDVSGHGISSGLVTMLSKSIINREFENGLNEKLSTVMYNINDKICEAKGDIENYLTGILLRFKENSVDYVNAGHPLLLFRNAGGKVVEASVPGSSATGSLVGMRYLPVEYKTTRFTMHSGDSLLIFTDCLQESRNLKGEEYTASRIMESFSNARSPNAQQKLKAILNDFDDFTKDVPLKDDLTVIMIVKK